jgi:tetratricopeptide (TPR) repeat protein
MPVWSSEIKEIERLYQSMKGRFPDIEKELERLIKTDDENIILVYSRRCLEVIITDLCEAELNRPRKTEPLKGIIDKLSHEEKVPSHIIASMDGLNSLSTFGAHPKDFDPEQVKPVLSNLSIIIKWYLKYKEARGAGEAETGGETVTSKVEPGVSQMTGTFREAEEDQAGAKAKTDEAKTDEAKTIGIIKTETEKTETRTLEAFRFFFRKFRMKFVLPAAVFIGLILFIIFSSGSTLPFSKRDWIVITDFENHTDDPVFDKSLYTAFSLATSQSRYINIFPRSRMIETLRRMKISEQAPIDDKTGREIAIREGIDIYIVPSINEVGNRYAITAKILESKTGNPLKSEIFYASTQDEILPALDKLSRKLRRSLGESRYDIAVQSKPLQNVTTSSLDALKLYSIGIENHIRLDFQGARDYYESALEIDTGFTAAKASLGGLLIERFEPAKGRELLNQAVRSVDNLTERERLGILAFYAVNVEKNLPEGIEYARMRIKLYPDDPASRNNLGWYYQNCGRFGEALEEYKAAIRIDPNMAITYGGICWIYLELLGNPDSALVWAENMVTDNPQNAWSYYYLGSAWICLDNFQKTEMACLKAKEINPDFILNLFQLAHCFRLQGKYDDAIAILQDILDITRTGPPGFHDIDVNYQIAAKQNEASAYYDLGINYKALGNQAEAQKYFSSFKKIATEEWLAKMPENPGTYLTLSSVSAQLDDSDASASHGSGFHLTFPVCRSALFAGEDT